MNVSCFNSFELILCFLTFQECCFPWLKTVLSNQTLHYHCAHEVTSGLTGPSLSPLVHPFPSPLTLPSLHLPNHGPKDLWNH